MNESITLPPPVSARHASRAAGLGELHRAERDRALRSIRDLQRLRDDRGIVVPRPRALDHHVAAAALDEPRPFAELVGEWLALDRNILQIVRLAVDLNQRSEVRHGHIARSGPGDAGGAG